MSVGAGAKVVPAYARSYEDFWPYFMERHEHPWTRRLHVVATVIGLFCVGVLFPLTFNATWLIAAPVIGYPIAWFSHLVFEKKKPAAWRHPYWSFLCDLDMMAMSLSGTLDQEVERLRREPQAPFSARRRFLHQATQVAIAVAVLFVVALRASGGLLLVNPLIGN